AMAWTVAPSEDGEAMLDDYRAERQEQHKPPELIPPKPINESIVPNRHMLIGSVIVLALVLWLWSGMNTPTDEAEAPQPLAMTEDQSALSVSGDPPVIDETTVDGAKPTENSAAEDGQPKATQSQAAQPKTNQPNPAQDTAPSDAAAVAAVKATPSAPTGDALSTRAAANPSTAGARGALSVGAAPDAASTAITTATTNAAGTEAGVSVNRVSSTNDAATKPAPQATPQPDAAKAPLTKTEALEKIQAAPPPTNSRPSPMVIRAISPTVIKIMNAEGAVVFEKALSAGETYVVPDEKGLRLGARNLGNLRLSYGGADLPALGKSSEGADGINLDRLAPKPTTP
ncbi:MAG: DUF4115 domain-containing protein, partial [Alphaproteobacteria bacterium]|nr:DUF4115 domain-containing protein [Alphaproteobacteria bacterium]